MKETRHQLQHSEKLNNTTRVSGFPPRAQSRSDVPVSALRTVCLDVTRGHPEPLGIRLVGQVPDPLIRIGILDARGELTQLFPDRLMAVLRCIGEQVVQGGTDPARDLGEPAPTSTSSSNPSRT